MATAADVNAVREKVQKLKGEMTSVDQQYKLNATKRIEAQNRLAKMSQTVQEKSKDIMLVEDIVVVTLASETLARSKLPPIDNPADKRPPNQTPGKVSSAEEAVKIYTGQMNILQEDIEYRTFLRDSEKDMVEIYESAKNEMLQLMDEYCNDESLKSKIQAIAQ